MSVSSQDVFGHLTLGGVSPTVPLENKKSKKKKRARDEEQPDVQVRQKKKKSDVNQGYTEQPPSMPDETSAHIGPPTKPKKRKKDKGNANVLPLSEQTDAEIEANSQASAAALFSAIVAASITNSEAPQVSPPLPIDPRLVAPPGSPFPDFPQFPYGYLPPSATFDPSNGANPANIQHTGPASGGLPFSELTFASNDELLRALQDLDMSKMASVLKSLGEATSAPAFAPQLSFMPAQLGQVALPSMPAPSNAILGIPSKNFSLPTAHKRTIDMSLPGNEQHANPGHAHLLATKWLNASKLAELVRSEGLVYKKGKFSAIEEQQLETAMERYRLEKQLTEEQVVEIIFSKTDKSKDTAFWSELTAAIPLRPIIAVYHHVRRSYHPLKLQGPWTACEDEALKRAVTDLGQHWEKVHVRVGRMASDCRDRYRNHILNRDIRITGHWSKEEEEKLTQIVTDMTVKQGKDIDNDVFWGKVSDLMGNKRGRQQCRIKWTDALSKTIKNEGQKPRWSQQDAFILVHKVDSLNVRDDTEIDWKLISDPDWNLWSAHTLQRRWLTLKKGIKSHEDMTHQEIMDILRIKKAHLPTPPPLSPKKKRKVTSAESVEDADEGDEYSTPEDGLDATLVES